MIYLSIIQRPHDYYYFNSWTNRRRRGCRKKKKIRSVMPQCEHSVINWELPILSHASQDTVLFQKKCLRITLPAPHNPFQDLWNQGHNFKLVQTFHHGRLGSAEVTATSSLSEWHCGVSGESKEEDRRTARESWYFIKVIHLADFALPSLDLSSFLHPCYPLLLILMCLPSLYNHHHPCPPGCTAC